MAPIGPILGALGAITTVASTGFGIMSSIQQGKAQQALFEAEAREQERVGKEKLAESTREAYRRNREVQLAQSRLQAAAAGSGADASGPTVSNLAAGIAREGSYQTRGIVYEGQSAKVAYDTRGALARMQGRMARQEGLLRGIEAGIGGASSLIKAFGGLPADDSGRSGGRSYARQPYSGYVYRGNPW